MFKEIQISAIDLRYLVSIALVLLASIKKKRGSMLNAVVASLIWWVAFGNSNTLYLLLSIMVNIVLLFACSLNTYHFTILNILNLYIYKIFGRSFEPRIQSTFDISGALMILTVKMGYLAKDFDGKIGNVLNYIFFVPGLVTGPTSPYKVFVERNRAVDVPFPWTEALKTVSFLIVHVILRPFPFETYITSPNCGFALKLIFLYLFNVRGRTRFHFAWNFSHCCFTLYNLPEYLNIDFFKVELTESVREISSYWNQFISTWLKTLFFNPLKETSMAKAVVVSHLVSAALHGINPCYVIFFLSFALYSKPVSFVNSLIKYKILRQIQMVFFVSYFSMPFYLLDVLKLLRIWKGVYFYGHIYFTFLFIWYWTQRLLGKVEKSKKVEVKKKSE